MSNELTFSLINDTTAVIRPIEDDTAIINYSEILKMYTTNFRRTPHYLEVGEINWTQGWILHLSVITIQLPKLLRTIVPILIRINIPFTIVRNVDVASSILGGEFGNIQLGKVVSIYPPDAIQANSLAKQLIGLTSSFRGPAILTDRYLGGAVYTRYGACKPIVQTNNSGIEENCIYDTQGNLVPDPHNIPFILQPSINWPFTDIVPANVHKRETVLQDKYKPMAILKEDLKGTVKKGLWLKKLYQIKWCVLKEGKQNMCTDLLGRDMGDRLRWQYELQKDLEGLLPIPSVHDLFEENGDTYLVMDYIQGTALEHIITDSFHGRTWWHLSKDERLLSLGYIEQVLVIIEKMHQLGYIHRDITPANFIVDKNDQLIMIDLELSYSENLQKPYPPFRLGTPGFMSPEQLEAQRPTTQQDIFAIGGLFIVTLTGMLPSKFTTEDIKMLKEQLGFFVQDDQFVNLICNCFSENFNRRPTLAELKKGLEEFKAKQVLLEINVKLAQKVSQPSEESTKNIIQQAIASLTASIFVNPEQLWLSKSFQEEEISGHLSGPMIIQDNFCYGLSGILYFLSKAHGTNFSIRATIAGYRKSLEFIHEKYLKGIEGKPAGLHIGTAGIAVALLAGMESGLIVNKEEDLAEIKHYLQNENTDGYGITKGIAGRGLALLYAEKLIERPFVQPLLDKIVETLLDNQQKDGSWTTITDSNRTLLKVTGFGHGIAGITCFLLEYINQYGDRLQVKQAIINSLQWLIKQAQKSDNGLVWYVNSKSKQVEPGMLNGVAGIVITLIKAYEVLKDPYYMQFSEDILRSIPYTLVNNDITLANGITGIGEMYLEAIRVFQSDEWQSRVDWIVQFLLHHYRKEKDGSFYWSVDKTPNPTASFLSGNSGVIYFLMRYYQPGLLKHPLLFM